MTDEEERKDVYAEALALHRAHHGKLAVQATVPLNTRKDIGRAYTPGVAAVCRELERDPSLAYTYTIKGNTVAVVTDGSAVLGLGNIGGTAAIPVMEGKAALFKRLAGIDAFPICFAEQSADIVGQIRNLAPVFGGINLEDIAAPRCFEIEEELQDLGIPVMHDDQHATAIVVLAALMNACTATGKRLEDLRIVVIGAGAAGFAITRLLRCIGYESRACRPVRELLVCDREGIIHRNRHGLYSNKYKFIIGEETNRAGRTGSIADALNGADVCIGVSGPGVVTEEMVRSMNRDPIVFAMANPVPEIMPDEAARAGAAVIGTGRSDFPNQINNVLVFPGFFRGALDARAIRVTDEMKLAAATALAATIRRPTRDRILPSVLNRGVVRAVAAAVREAAVASGAATAGTEEKVKRGGA
ncbi:NAD(P)-dependent malic enzyme [Methanosphaerula subterraneus]|uniref:NAD(P)-dependent malic enzyme n=1 Tax=Methanosphaerula subterraneus TaxID=3350244 RepID=UPI003F83E30F